MRDVFISVYTPVTLEAVYLFICSFTSRSTTRGHIVTGSSQVEETGIYYCTVNHWASASNYQLSNLKHPPQDSNQRPQRLKARTLTTAPLSLLEAVYLQYLVFSSNRIASKATAFLPVAWQWYNSYVAVSYGFHRNNWTVYHGKVHCKALKSTVKGQSRFSTVLPL